MSKVVRATIEEKNSYRPDHVYPLYGFITIDGHQCAVEDLSGHWDKEDPQYEIMCPDGYHFNSEGTHSSLHWTLKEVREEHPGKLARCSKDNPNCYESCGAEGSNG